MYCYQCHEEALNSNEDKGEVVRKRPLPFFFEGKSIPEHIDHKFESIQMFKAKKLPEIIASQD